MVKPRQEAGWATESKWVPLDTVQEAASCSEKKKIKWCHLAVNKSFGGRRSADSLKLGGKCSFP